MPITELPAVDERTTYVRLLFELIKDSESGQRPYREAHERTIAEAAAKAALSERMSRASKARKGRRWPGSRPYQKAGFASRKEWLDHIDAQPQPDQSTQEA